MANACSSWSRFAARLVDRPRRRRGVSDWQPVAIQARSTAQTGKNCAVGRGSVDGGLARVALGGIVRWFAESGLDARRSHAIGGGLFSRLEASSGTHSQTLQA